MDAIVAGGGGGGGAANADQWNNPSSLGLGEWCFTELFKCMLS